MAKVEYLTALFEAGQGNGHGACLATVSRPALAVSLVVMLTGFFDHVVLWPTVTPPARGIHARGAQGDVSMAYLRRVNSKVEGMRRFWAWLWMLAALPGVMMQTKDWPMWYWGPR